MYESAKWRREDVNTLAAKLLRWRVKPARHGHPSRHTVTVGTEMICFPMTAWSLPATFVATQTIITHFGAWRWIMGRFGKIATYPCAVSQTTLCTIGDDRLMGHLFPGAEPSLTNFDSAWKNCYANLQNCFAQLTPPNLLTKIPDFVHVVLLDGTNSFFGV